MKKVPTPEVATPDQSMRADLPEAVQASLVGLGVMAELMAAEVDEVAGPKGKHDPARRANRHGSERGSVTLGGRRVGAERPRMRSADGTEEVPVATYDHFASRDPLTELVFERMLAGVSTATTLAPARRSASRSKRMRVRPRVRRSAASSSPRPGRPSAS